MESALPRPLRPSLDPAPAMIRTLLRLHAAFRRKPTLCTNVPDSDCKFQPGKAIGFVKDVANITIVSADTPLGWGMRCEKEAAVMLSDGQQAQQGSPLTARPVVDDQNKCSQVDLTVNREVVVSAYFSQRELECE
ncbi:hypothetical protein P7K49_013061 [Saguinus oedipus]|uniref:Uncharacterized protein n=1 Tax=Saguinus oedipus TaxID=9490 RepID=A0ABQ9VF50_SAGOE|nr:hypothetical protein P7K49_013061 [Saguinus oedipus]